MTESASILLVSPDNLTVTSLEFIPEVEVFHFAALPQALKAQEYMRPDLIIVDEASLAPNAGLMVHEFKHRNPTVPVIIVMDGADIDRQRSLVLAGADDFLFRDRDSEESELTVYRALRQSKHLRSLSTLNSNLHAMTSLSRILYEAIDTRTLLEQAAHLLRTTLRLYGVCIVLRQDDVYRAVVSSEDYSASKKPYETIFRPTEGDPFVWTTENQSIQLYDNIQQYANYEPIPVLASASVAAIVPLGNDGDALGAVGIFQRNGHSITYTDCFVYEEFARHLGSALTQVGETVTKSVQLNSRQLLLQAWQSFAEYTRAEDVLTNLCRLINSVQEVANVVLRVPKNATGDLSDAWITEDGPTSGLPFESLMDDAEVRQRIEVLAASPEPVVMDVTTANDEKLGVLLEALGGQKLVALPVKISGQARGIVFVTIAGPHDLSVEGLALLRTLCLVADQIIDRLTLSSEIYSTNRHLEAILRSVSEGVFFVNQDDNVVYMTPQFTELTSINPSGILGQDVQTLLRALADCAANPAKTYAQLDAAHQEIVDLDGTSDAYPIVHFQLTDSERVFTIELVRISEQQSNSLGWCGIVRSGLDATRSAANLGRLIEVTNSSFEIPYGRIRGLLEVMNEQRRPMTTAWKETVGSELLSNVQIIGNLWSDFTAAWWLQSDHLTLSKTATDIQAILLGVIKEYPDDRTGITFQVRCEDSLPKVNCDPYWMQRSIRTILGRAVAISPRRSTVGIRVSHANGMVSIAVDDRGDSPDELELSTMFTLTPNATTGPSMETALFLARELVLRHGGDISAEQGHEHGTTVTLSLPALIPEVKHERNGNGNGNGNGTHALARSTNEDQLALSRGAPARYTRTAMVLTGEAELTGNVLRVLRQSDYEIFEFDSVEEAIENLSLVRIGLIIVDVTVDDGAGLKSCERIRKRSPVPMLLVSDTASDAEKVAALKAGADDYITMPISQAELAARIEVIVKRQDITDRSREPIVVGELQVDVARRQVLVNDQPLELTRIEYDLLHALLTNSGRVLTHRELLEIVWGPEYADDTQYLWVNISRLRKKVERRANAPRYIHTQPGVGYYFDDHGPGVEVGE